MSKRNWHKIRPLLYGAASIYMGYIAVNAVLTDTVTAFHLFHAAFSVWSMYHAITEWKLVRIRK